MARALAAAVIGAALSMASPAHTQQTLAEKLLTYGTGGAPERADQAEVEAIVSFKIGANVSLEG